MENSKNGKNATFEDELEVMRERILAETLEEAVFEGWTVHGLEKAAISAGMTAEEVKRGDLKLAFPKGIADILDFWSEQADEKMVSAYLEADPAPEKIREKVRFLVKARLEALADHKEAARRASATMALPLYASLAAKLSWPSMKRRPG